MNNYRKNVAAIVLDAAHQILLFERADHTSWGFPQGGIETGETSEEALLRELSEELGITSKDFDILAKAPKLLRYDFPAGMSFRDWDYIGQEQQYFLVKLHLGVVLDFTSFPEEIEFLQYKPVSFENIMKMDFAFKTDVYRAALNFFEKDILE
ncbi:MAG: RNA pyrophosphohydrolase [Streptococcaceae bacterium]|jgi:putative (di)nucleoside polyphosphate hydrolase|nr:RNA pyrophosphohydrolase [Streptococcaceae bacterium]